MSTGPQRRHLRLVTDEPVDVVAARRQPHSPRKTAARYLVKVALTDIEPEIWRLLQVSSDITLDEFHEALQVAMGWQNYHLHNFVLGDDPWDRDAVTYHSQTEIDHGDLDPDTAKPEAGVRLDELLAEPGDSICYVYDYGDDWTHRLTLEAAGNRIPNPTRCIDGARACPPEDCGGPPGYAHLLEVLADPDHPEHTHLRSWAGDFEPERFGVADVNTALRNKTRRTLAFTAAARQSALVANLLSRTNPGAVPLLADALDRAHLDDAAEIDPTEASVALTKITWMIDHIGDRLKLTGAGFLPPASVAQMREELDWNEWKFYGRSNREGDHLQATLLRESMVELGLARKVKGELVPTKTAAKLRYDALGLWRHTASRAPRGRDKAEREAGVIALIAVAANMVGDDSVVLQTMPALGWHAEHPHAYSRAALPTEWFLRLLDTRQSRESSSTTATFARAALTLGDKV